MGHVTKRVLTLLVTLVLMLSLTVFPAGAKPAASDILTAPTGYTAAGDVAYQSVHGTFYDVDAGRNIQRDIIVNWGARGEDCLFLSTYAEAFYTGGNTYASLSSLSGTSTQNQVPGSDLYKALQTLMMSNHTFYTYYDASVKNVREYYAYTDCVSNDATQVSLLYRGGLETSQWNQGKLWNQEHVWPQSKCLSDRQIGDIMHLRPSNPSENSSRGNDAYGESAGYYDPGVSVRGDCARMVLYMYVRWGNSSNMWGKNGVIESIDVLLKWMEEDPVDTWEMGRNDAVESITGTRNVFVDYPELAWLLFDAEVPSDMVTPSGMVKNAAPSCAHAHTELRNAVADTCTTEGYTGDLWCTDCGQKLQAGRDIQASGHKETLRNAMDATCTTDGYSGDAFCKDCGMQLSTGTVIAATGHTDADSDNLCDVCTEAIFVCTHATTEVRNAQEATCTAEGYTGDTYCTVCGEQMSIGQAIPMVSHTAGELMGYQAPGCAEDGYSGNTFCQSCGIQLTAGETIAATGQHTYGDWQITREATAEETGLRSRSCTECGHKETVEIPMLETPSLTGLWITLAAVGAAAVIAVVIIVVKRK